MSASIEASHSWNHEAYNTIPDTVTSISVGLTSATTAAALTAFKGKWVWLKARVGTITVLRGTATVVSGVGLVLTPGQSVPFYVSSESAVVALSMISDTASSYLDILSDSEAG